MSNYFGNFQPQSNNKYMNNRMMQEYYKTSNNNVPFTNNRMLMDNPTFFSNIYDPSFFSRINLEKAEQMKKVKNVGDLGMSQDMLTNFVICPIKIEKEDSNKLKNKYNDKFVMYDGFKDKNSASEATKALWKGRTNNPYKNIMYDEDYTKNFEKEDDLIVHKVTSLDRNFIKTMKDFESMAEFIVEHNGELRIKYSPAKKNMYKEKFDYENKIKYRIKYDPKNYNELKKFYKQEQKKLKKSNKRVDEIIELLLASEDFSKAELDNFSKPSDEEEIDDDLTMVFEKGDESLEKRLEQELVEEYGQDALNELMDEYCVSNEEVYISKKKNSKIKLKSEHSKLKTNDDPIKKVLIKPKNTKDSQKESKQIIKKIAVIKPKVKETKIETNTIGNVDATEFEQYKKLQKSAKK